VTNIEKPSIFWLTPPMPGPRLLIERPCDGVPCLMGTPETAESRVKSSAQRSAVPLHPFVALLEHETGREAQGLSKA